jgi:hypothetical protein
MSSDFSVKDILSLCVDWSVLSTTRTELDDCVTAVAGASATNEERRTDKRRPVVLDVIAVPLDQDQQPCGEPFMALTRNISRGGIAILHTEKVTAPYLLLKMETARHETMQIVVQVVRLRSFYQFTEICGRFELKAEKKPTRPRSPKRRSRAAAR